MHADAMIDLVKEFAEFVKEKYGNSQATIFCNNLSSHISMQLQKC